MFTSFYQELSRRNVLRIGFAYLAGSWLLIQIAEVLFPIFELDEAALRIPVIVLAIGFVPSLVLAWVFEFTPKGLVVDSDLPTEAEDIDSQAAPQSRLFDRIVLVVLALAVTFFAVDKFVLTEELTPASEFAEKFSKFPPTSIAVLPFVNMSSDKNNEYFSDGLTDTLLHMLAGISDLHVSARTSSFAFKGKNQDIRTIALALGVMHVLEGSVQKSNNRIRVTAQLIRAVDGFHVWSQKYDRDLNDVFAIQDEIAEDVAKSLGSTLLGTSQGGITSIQTESLSAYDIYLQGLAKHVTNTNESLKEAEALFSAALLVDPEFTDAKLALARNYVFRMWKLHIDNAVGSMAAAKLLDSILAENPGHLSAQGLRLIVRNHQNVDRIDMHEVEAIFNEIVGLMSKGQGDPYVRREAIQYLTGNRRFAEAEELLRDGLRVDPLNYDLLWAQATMLIFTDRHQEAVPPLMTARSLRPDNPLIHWRLGVAAWAAGEIVAGFDWFRMGADLDPNDAVIPGWIARELYFMGFVEQADLWRAKSLQADRESSMKWILKLNAVKARGNGDEIIKVSLEAIEHLLEQGRGPMDQAIGAYAEEMNRQGRSQEAIDYVKSHAPRFGDPAWIPQDPMIFMLRGYAFFLWMDILEPEAFRDHAKTYIDALKNANFSWEGNHAIAIPVNIWRGDLDSARGILLDQVEPFPLDRNIWRTVRDYVWFEELRRVPEVTTRLEEVAVVEAQLRKDVEEMLQRPEWVIATGSIAP